VISTRDVIFDKKSHFDSKHKSLTDTLIREKDKLIKRAMMPEKLAANESIVQEDDDLISLYNSKDEEHDRDRHKALRNRPRFLRRHNCDKHKAPGNGPRFLRLCLQ
jgi:hypothetical protein